MRAILVPASRYTGWGSAAGFENQVGPSQHRAIVEHFERRGGGDLISRERRGMIELDDQLVEPPRDQIRARCGFEAGIEHLALFGLCSDCAEREAETETGSIDIEPGKSVYLLNH